LKFWPLLTTKIWKPFHLDFLKKFKNTQINVNLKKGSKCHKHIGIPQSNHMAIKFFYFSKMLWNLAFINHLYLKTPLEHLQGCSICDLVKIYFTSKLSYVLFCNPTHKTKTRTSNRWGTTNSKPPAPIIMMGQSETLSSSQIVFITLVFAGAQRCCAVPFISYGNMHNYVKPNPFP